MTQNKHPKSIKGACGHSKKLLDPSKIEIQHRKLELLPLNVWHPGLGIGQRGLPSILLGLLFPNSPTSDTYCLSPRLTLICAQLSSMDDQCFWHPEISTAF